MSARLLQKVAYRSRMPHKYHGNDLCGNEVTVLNTFPYNPESSSSSGTAKSWANNNKSKAGVVPPEVVLDNEPFEVTIIDLDIRMQGGRAYKVIDEKRRMFDLREDQVLEAIGTCGINPGGKINGKFQWGISGSQCKLALVGGGLHNEMLEGLNNAKKEVKLKESGEMITPGKCVPGCVYRRLDKYVLYVGKFKYPGEKKFIHATLDLDGPDAEPYFLDWDYDDQGRRVEHKDEVNWPTSTWDERVKAMLRRDRYMNLNFQGSFKGFHEKVGEIEASTVAELRQIRRLGNFKTEEFEKTDTKPVYSSSSWYSHRSNDYSTYQANLDSWSKRAIDWFLANVKWAN